VLRRTGLTYTRTQVASEDIFASAVTSTAIADGAVTGPKIGLTAINANNIVNGAVTAIKIASSTITTGQFASSANSAITGKSVAMAIVFGG
jgi:hypothetical protein